MKFRKETNRYTLERSTAPAAASYDTKYERQLHKRISNRAERALLDRLLALAGPAGDALDAPCGAGRVADVFQGACRRLIQSDYSVEMLRLVRRNFPGSPLRMAAATAFYLPFRDRSFDLAISIRLSHHIPDSAGRIEHLKELLRVSRRHVIVSFFDSGSLKNRVRELRRRCGLAKRGKYTLSRAEVSELCRQCGFRPVRYRSLSRLFSGHTFALLERTAASIGSGPLR